MGTRLIATVTSGHSGGVEAGELIAKKTLLPLACGNGSAAINYQYLLGNPTALTRPKTEETLPRPVILLLYELVSTAYG